MRLKQIMLIYNLLKATSFWRDNYIILRELKSFRRLIVLALVFTLMAALFEGFTIGLVAVFLRSFTTPDKPPFETGLSWFDVSILGINESASSRLYRSSTLLLLVAWVRSSFAYLGELNTKLSELNLAEHLRKRLFEQFQALSLGYFSKKRAGELISSVTGEVNQISHACQVVSIFIAKGSTVLVYVASLLCLSWQLTTISVLLFTLLAAGLSTLVRRIREESFEVVKANRHLMLVTMEFISGIRTVQAFVTQDFERRRFYEATAEQTRVGSKALSAAALVQPLTQGMSTTILAVILVVSLTAFVANGSLEIASLITFLFVLLRLAPFVGQLNKAWSQLSSFQGPLTDIRELLRTDDKPYLKNGKIQFPGMMQAIEFVSVDFGYSANNLVLHDVTLTIEQGQVTALVGSSGAGKSTLADLISRFYDPTKGRILIDGFDLREFEVNSLRRKTAVVSQDTFIFNTSIWNNIAYGTEDADELAIQEVAQQAGALQFILEMPEGFETILGDRGVRLSGGQRQRIAIARALLRDPEILILDEATSALDSVSEQLIQKAIEKLSAGRTVIAIAHRLSTVVRADKVVVLEQGRVVEQGRYRELLELRGRLWKYHQTQYELGQAG